MARSWQASRVPYAFQLTQDFLGPGALNSFSKTVQECPAHDFSWVTLLFQVVQREISGALEKYVASAENLLPLEDSATHALSG